MNALELDTERELRRLLDAPIENQLEWSNLAITTGYYLRISGDGEMSEDLLSEAYRKLDRYSGHAPAYSDVETRLRRAFTPILERTALRPHESHDAHGELKAIDDALTLVAMLMETQLMHLDEAKALHMQAETVAETVAPRMPLYCELARERESFGYRHDDNLPELHTWLQRFADFGRPDN